MKAVRLNWEADGEVRGRCQNVDVEVGLWVAVPGEAESSVSTDWLPLRGRRQHLPSMLPVPPFSAPHQPSNLLVIYPISLSVLALATAIAKVTLRWPLFLQNCEQMEEDVRRHFSGRGGYIANQHTGTVNPTNQANANEVTMTCGLTSVKGAIERWKVRVGKDVG